MFRLTVTIEGMACSMCEAHVNEAIRRAFAVKKVKSSHAKGETVIETAERIAEDQLRAVIEGTGYRVLAVTEEPFEKKGLFSFGKSRKQ